jgi:hypothetical protein
MALHRDIFWVGKQWAVTGYGMQACDQKQKSQFDIEASRLWEDGLLDSVRGQRWFNLADFDKALAMARTRFPQPPVPANAVSAVVATASRAEATTANGPRNENPDPAPPNFAMRAERCRARLLPTWRVRVNLQR